MFCKVSTVAMRLFTWVVPHANAMLSLGRQLNGAVYMIPAAIWRSVTEVRLSAMTALRNTFKPPLGFSLALRVSCCLKLI